MRLQRPPNLSFISRSGLWLNPHIHLIVLPNCSYIWFKFRYYVGDKIRRFYMKFSSGAASLLALALFVCPALAQEAPPPPIQSEQPGDPAVDAAAPAIPAEVLALLSDARAATELSGGELKARIKQAQHFAKDESLAQDVRDQMTALADASRAELEARAQAVQPRSKREVLPAPVAEQAPAPADAPPPPVAEQQAAPPPQPEPQAEQAAPAQLPVDVLALISDNRAVADLTVDELRARAKSARQFSKNPRLPQDVRDQLNSINQTARAEIAAREQQVVPQVEPAPAIAQDVSPPPPVVQEVQSAEPPAAAVPDEVIALLGDGRPPAELSVEELQARASAARRFAKNKKLPEDVRARLSSINQAARTEITAREQQAAPQSELAPAVTQDPPPPVAQEVQPAEPPAATVPDNVMALLNDSRAPSELSDEDLRARAKAARRFAKNERLPQDVRAQLDAMAKSARNEIAVREQQQAQAQAAPPPPILVEPPPATVDAPAVEQAQPVAPPPPTAADVRALDNNSGDPQAESQARDYLNDATPIERLSDEELRSRLDGIRVLMSANVLSRGTERAVRQKLRVEREALRSRLAQAEANQAVVDAAQRPEPPPPPRVEDNAVAERPLPPVPIQPPAPPATDNNSGVSGTLIITNVTPIQIVLRDRRPPEELQLDELQRRVQVYNEAQYSEDYDEANRDYWRAAIRRDRQLLRRRMIEERHRREEQLAFQASDDNLDIDINVEVTPNRPRPRRDVFAAEVDDQELEDVLVAPPRKSIKKRYSLEEIAVQPRLRDTVSRIEIDTIRFGTNEAFIREEQVNSLDGIAAIIERIVKKYPNEVFMIEGHTDAVGSDAHNKKLSKLRAEAVKRALISYYVISARNLRTVGLGERFLKIPTAEAEAENRRVSISRVTQLLGTNQ
jgi:outer membrane protein OmpA-like peptidoglycan-associated protein/cation transport regulator ChaB